MALTTDGESSSFVINARRKDRESEEENDEATDGWMIGWMRKTFGPPSSISCTCFGSSAGRKPHTNMNNNE